MKLGMEVGLGPGHIVLDGDPALYSKGAQLPPFSPHICCSQTTGWAKMPLGTKVGLGQGDIVFDDDPAPLKRGTAPHFLAYVYCGQTVVHLSNS